MTARQKLDANERREELFRLAWYHCLVCDRWLREGVPQMAHRAPKGELSGFLKGHPFMMVPTEKLTCNSAVLISGLPLAALIKRCEDNPTPTDAEIKEYYAELKAEFRH